mmetsp:Transcript_118281/g.209053  ORF Transcript_118281/g.209053 Transcript_118281/m.209053 type:complete len:209 (-) Transcript_118281:743-1369(-)
MSEEESQGVFAGIAVQSLQKAHGGILAHGCCRLWLLLRGLLNWSCTLKRHRCCVCRDNALVKVVSRCLCRRCCHAIATEVVVHVGSFEPLADDRCLTAAIAYDVVMDDALSACLARCCVKCSDDFTLQVGLDAGPILSGSVLTIEAHLAEIIVVTIKALVATSHKRAHVAAIANNIHVDLRICMLVLLLVELSHNLLRLILCQGEKAY